MRYWTLLSVITDLDLAYMNHLGAIGVNKFR